MAKRGTLFQQRQVSCYDIIVHSVAYCDTAPRGTNSTYYIHVLHSLTITTQDQDGFGDSAKAYSIGRDIPLQDMGQGNRAAVVISTPIINMMKRAGHGLSLLTAISATLAMIKQLVLELGLGGHPLQQDYKKFHLNTTNSWIKSTWHFTMAEKIG